VKGWTIQSSKLTEMKVIYSTSHYQHNEVTQQSPGWPSFREAPTPFTLLSLGKAAS